MHTVEAIFIMLALILLSYVIHTFVREVAVSLIQVGLGILYVLLPFSVRLNLETELFILIFIAPILFMDGKRFKSRELLSFKTPILYLVLGLVFVNVLVVGYAIHLLLHLPLPVSFAMAAVLSPTDAVAVKAITSNIKLPHRVSSIIEGESMFNDASGVVAFNFAILAQITGIFNMRELVGSFISIAVGGLLIGILFAFAVNFCVYKLKCLGVDEPNFFTLLQLLTPFAVFIAAEHFHLSGILAVVACGKTLAILSPKLMTLGEASIRFASEGAWNIFLFMLSGLAFVLLGMETPSILRDMMAEGFSPMTGLGYVLAVTALLIALRYVWVYLFMDDKEVGRAKNALLMALSGVRGVLTLAVCLSIPFTLIEGQVFVERSLILFVASGVIILSLIIANISLPFILRGEKEDELSDEAAAVKTIKRSIKSIRQARTAQNGKTCDLLISYFEYMIDDLLHKNRKAVHFNLKDCGSESQREVLRIGLGGGEKKQEVANLLAMEILDKYELEFISVQIQKLQIERLVAKGELSSRAAYRLRRNLSLEESALFEDDIESME